MSVYRNRYSSILPEGLVRDTANGKVAGVCAGLGGYFQIQTKWIRILFLVSFVLTSFFPVLIGYILLAILMPVAPKGFAYTPTFDEKGKPAPTDIVLKDHFATLDHRLANMEAWVTSEDYRLRQQFKNL